MLEIDSTRHKNALLSGNYLTVAERNLADSSVSLKSGSEHLCASPYDLALVTVISVHLMPQSCSSAQRLRASLHLKLTATQLCHT